MADRGRKMVLVGAEVVERRDEMLSGSVVVDEVWAS
jgi:hypothetical protein